jgi:hypothetical protein
VDFTFDLATNQLIPTNGVDEITLKWRSREPVRIHFHRDGTDELLPSGFGLALYLKRSTTMLATCTSFTAPAAATGYYTGTLILNTDPLTTAFTTATVLSIAAKVEAHWWASGESASPSISDSVVSAQIVRPVVAPEPSSVETVTLGYEGTDIKSTGETGGAKYLREDGDGTCSWQSPSGSGDALVANNLDQFASVTQTAGQTLAITASTTLSGGTHSGTNTGDQDLSSYLTSATASTTYQPLDADLTSIAGLTKAGNTLKVIRVNAGETAYELATVSGGGGSGDVVGPASSTDNAFARFDLTTGKLLQNSTATLSDVGLASLDAIQFSTAPTSTVGYGRAVWDTTDSCLSVGLNASVNALVGTDSHVQVYNDSASPMTVMQVVRQSGSSGTRLKVALALANTDSNSATTIGVVAQSIASNAQGFIQTSGLLRGVDTNAFEQGDTLWLSATTAGLITNVKPTAPNHGVRIGYCIKKAGGAGIILIDILNGFELDELHDVKITGPIVDNSFLTYDTTSAVWINEAPSAARSSIGLGSVTDDAQTKAAIVPNTAPTAGQLLVGNAGGTAYAPVSLNNDATVASTGALTLATVNSNVGAFGSATQAPAVTVNAKGLVTAISASTITPAVGSVTGLGTGVATALAVNVGSAGAPVVNGGALGTPSSGNLASCTFPTLNQNTSGYAEALKSATTTVSVSAATAPTNGQVLTATSGTAATWQTPSGGGGGKLAQLVYTEDATAKSTTTSFPLDDTVPTNTEGVEYTELATTITPTNASSRLKIDVTLLASPNAVNAVAAFLYKNSDSAAIAGNWFSLDAGYSGNVVITTVISAGSTSAQTFKVRYGRTSGSATIYLNDTPTSYYGGTMKSSMTITEILP